MEMDVDRRKTTTFGYEQRRAVAAGILETAGSTFLLLIAVKHFSAGETAKGWIATGGSGGLMLSPLVVTLVRARQWRASVAASFLSTLCGLGFLIVVVLPMLPVFIVGSVLALVCVSAAIPLMTQIYQDNYPAAERGKLFTRTVMIRILTAAAFSFVAGQWLETHLNEFRWLMLVFAGAMFFSSYCLARYPSQPLHDDGSGHWFRGFQHLRSDKTFRDTMIAWMMMGTANLMMFPLRVEYLTNPRYKLALSAAAVAIYTGVIPNVARFIMSPLWGRWFDSINFFLLRILLNVGFALGIFTFFMGGRTWELTLAAVILGVVAAGADVAWSLWVTKIAPPERVAEYMSVHTCLAGVRGVVAPLVSFHLVQVIPIQYLGAMAAGMILISCLLLIPEARFARRRRAAAPLVEEVSE